MFSDKETDIDALGFESYTDSLSELVTKKGITPFTIGIFGTWGSGKTSLMLMLRKKLESHYNVRTIWFNAWKFDDEEQIWAALIQAILSQLDKPPGNNAKLRLEELINSIEWMNFLKFVSKSLISGIPDINGLKESVKFSKKTETILGFEEKFEKLVDSYDIERLVVFIDDLDRCKMDATIDILEAIKLLLNSKKCVYILGLDYQRVLDAVSGRFVESSRKVAEDYLDKIIQLSFYIPRRTEMNMRLYLRYLFALEYVGEENLRRFSVDIRKIEKNIDKKFTRILSNYTENFSIDQYEALIEHEKIIIWENEFNPRKLKRFLNAYEMGRSLSKTLKLNLKTEYLIKFLLLQTKFTDFYQELERYPELLYQMKELIPLSEDDIEKELENSKLLKKYYSEELLRFLRDVAFEDVDPRPYLRIAQAPESEIVLGEEERIVLNDLMSDDSVKILQGSKNFYELSKEQKETTIQDLLKKTEQVDAKTRQRSLQAFGSLRGAIPVNLMEDVLRRLIELADDEDADVRERANWTLQGLREFVPENIERDVEETLKRDYKNIK